MDSFTYLITPLFLVAEDPIHPSRYLHFWKVLRNKDYVINVPMALLTIPGCSTAGLLGGGSVSIGGGVGGGGAPTDVVQHQQESCCSLQLKTGVQVRTLTTTVLSYVDYILTSLYSFGRSARGQVGGP